MSLKNCIQPMAVLSTAHIPRHTAEDLGFTPAKVHNSDLYRTLSYEPWADYGWIFWVPEDERLPELARHPDLAYIFRRCREEGITYLLLDRDAPPCDDFVTFDW